ncbi:MAG: hypothetical protein IAG13_34130 [Deltaproteobacteria bacterium]|nr:hypothetical protein [Nannocystaceae bacterium]
MGATASAPAAAATPTAKPTTTKPARTSFERFELTGNEAGCPAQAKGDCVSAIELLADGTLRLDPWGEPATTKRLEAKLTPEEVERVSAPLTAPALLTLLDRADACSGANATETMLVRVAGTEHRNETGHCNDDAVQAARGAMIDLTTRHFREHDLISPPF